MPHFRPSSHMKKLFLSTLLMTLAFIAIFPSAPPYSQVLEIHCINVGQGASELVLGPNNTAILIDGGSTSAGSTVKSYLNTIPALGDHVIDYVIASHDDGDHYGGLTYILAHGYSATTIYNCGGDNSGFGRGVAIPVGSSLDLGNGANILCVVANGHLINGSTFSNSESNNQSIGLLITYGGFHYLTAGDMESAGEGPLGNALRTYPSGSPLLGAEGIDVLHVNHHGSRYSTTANYLNKLKPEVGVINVGANSYGHPHKDAIDRLLARTTLTSCACSCTGCSSTCNDATGVTVPPVAAIYQTAAGGTGDCRVSAEGTTAGNIIITYDGNSANYYVNDTTFPVDEGATLAPTLTPTRTPTTTKTSTPTPTRTPTRTRTPAPAATPTRTPTSLPTDIPSPSPTATPSAVFTPPPPPTSTSLPDTSPTPTLPAPEPIAPTPTPLLVTIELNRENALPGGALSVSAVIQPIDRLADAYIVFKSPRGAFYFCSARGISADPKAYVYDVHFPQGWSGKVFDMRIPESASPGVYTCYGALFPPGQPPQLDGSAIGASLSVK